MLPKIALLGRPNVGKSTLFNRLIRSNRAITHDRPGVTRDRMEGVVRSRGGRTFTLIDTGGVTLDQHYTVAQGPDELRGFEAEILSQTEAAMQEAAVFCLVVDARDGLMPFDEHLAAYIRRSGKPTLLVVNKVDGLEREDELTAEFHVLGFPMLALSAEHGHNIRALEEELADLLPDEDPEGEEQQVTALKLALLGRPNAGKSSLVNAMIGEERMIVSDVAGTTRDSVDIPFLADGRVCVFVDTAGVRRRTRITDTVELYSVNSSLKSTTKADVTLFIIDALEGVTAQDKRLIDLLDERKTPFMILVNKIDLVTKKERAELEKDFKEVLQFCQHVPVITVSALRGLGLGQIIPKAEQIRTECNTRIGTGALNRAMEEVLTKHQPPIVKRSRPKFFYLTQAEIAPPTFVFFVSDADRVADTYARYLERSLRRIFRIEHAPMRIRLRSSHKKKSER
ncbi:MAG: ribosome biogenesis GTPase Der [Bilophila sp.]